MLKKQVITVLAEVKGHMSCGFGNIARSKKHFNYLLQRNPHMNQKTKGNYRVVFGRIEQADN